MVWITCCLLDNANNIWFHNGQKNIGTPIILENINGVQMSDLTEMNGWMASIYIYQQL